MSAKRAIILYIIALLLTSIGCYIDSDPPNTSSFGAGAEFALMSLIIYAIVIGLHEGVTALLRLIRAVKK